MTTSTVAGQRRDRPTMKDVAAVAGVSLKTVSRVMDNVPTVAPELAARVREAATKLGYRPNLTASNLRRGDRRTHTVGLLLEDVSNPFAAAVHRGVEKYCADRGVLVLAASLEANPLREDELVMSLVNRRVDGLIIMPSAGTDHRYVVAEQHAGTSFVFIDRVPSPLVADAVVTDNHVSSRAAVTHLLSFGHRRIAYLGDSLALTTARERYEGYHEAMAAARVEVDPALVVHDLRTAEESAQATRRLLSTGSVEAVFTSQNLVTIGAVIALHEAGLQHQVAMVGFDDVPLAGTLQPALSVVSQNPAEVGRVAAHRLFARIDGDASAPSVHTVPTSFVERGSGELRRQQP